MKLFQYFSWRVHKIFTIFRKGKNKRAIYREDTIFLYTFAALKTMQLL